MVQHLWQVRLELTRRKVLKVAIERAKVEKLIVDLSRLLISVNCRSQLIVDLSRLSISVEMTDDD